MKKWISRGILCLSVPAVVIGGAWLFPGRRWVWGALCVVLLACAAVFLRFERKPADAKRLILIAALTALSVLGRILFAPIPSFKPVTAMVVITAMYFGSEAGFLTGALSAILSNIWFGQGAWTPFQMFAWGFVGFLAGLLAAPLKKSRLLLAVYGVLSGVLYSFLMDIWTVLFIDGYFNFPRYLAAIVSAAPVTATYAASNVIFLLLLAPPIGRILTRIKTKYAL